MSSVRSARSARSSQPKKVKVMSSDDLLPVLSIEEDKINMPSVTVFKQGKSHTYVNDCPGGILNSGFLTQQMTFYSAPAPAHGTSTSSTARSGSSSKRNNVIRVLVEGCSEMAIEFFFFHKKLDTEHIYDDFNSIPAVKELKGKLYSHLKPDILDTSGLNSSISIGDIHVAIFSMGLWARHSNINIFNEDKKKLIETFLRDNIKVESIKSGGRKLKKGKYSKHRKGSIYRKRRTLKKRRN